MNTSEDYYRVLQVQPDAVAAVIRSSYRTLMQTLRIHPDLGGDPGRAAQVNEAYAVLSDPARRRRYDAACKARADARPPMRRRAGDAPPPAARPARHCAFCASPVRHGAALAGGEAWRCATCGAPGSPPGGGPDACSGPGARSVPRVEHAAPVRFRRRWPQPVAHVGTVEDLSPIGMRFLSEVAVNPAELLLLDCGVLDALGRVVDARPRGERFQVRVAFEGVAVKQRQGGFLQTRA